MLELYRASAGSGKTYTLAKKYLWYYLTITVEDQPVRLREEAELADSARHILAITFTNKATNEMQQRIVAALYNIATRRKQKRKRPDGTVVEVNPDYMDEFCRTLGVPETTLADRARVALRTLLENYSDFNVSTIDSFFQIVLRTFAYESELNDSYQVELDTQFLSQLGVDATLEEIDSNEKDTDTAFWVKTLIDRTKSGKWNMFARKLGRPNDTSENPYKDFVEAVKKMENEEFKMIRDELDAYFRKYGSRLPELYRTLRNRYEPPVMKAFQKFRRLAKEALAALPDDLRGLTARSHIGKPGVFFRKAAEENLKWDSRPDHPKIPTFDDSILEKGKWQEWRGKHPAEAADVERRLQSVQEALDDWKALTADPDFRHWMLYALHLPFFALFSIVRRKRQEYLDENNAIELGETSMILRSVIGKSDTPFIFERLGTQLNHFLIDEFQDTSRMQWEILSPLVHETMSHEADYGNLIIGDAKQSIYRFRNADPSLITSIVPSEFEGRMEERGSVPAENTNYRSDLRVVQFNNSFFDYLIRRLDEATMESAPGRQLFASLYSNVVQRPDKTADAGYVNVSLSNDSKKKAGEPEAPKGAADVPELISRLLERDYLQREIAVLVQTHQEGEAVIEAINEYNATLEPDRKQIRFVSEQSLKVASARSVQIISGVLQNLARGANPVITPEEERDRRGVGVWQEHEANYKYFELKNSRATKAETLEAYVREGANFNALADLLENMKSLAIPAVVEAVCAEFLSPELRAKEAVYIAAFQDIVLEYCEGHPTDIGSFLRWWERKKMSASIASPEDSEAVQIITIHKSKGLQYECVIIPFANWKFDDDGRGEWRWVVPALDSPIDVPLPPRLPVDTTEELRGTSHEKLLDQYYDQVRMDRLNAIYVAFTRAKKELYILGRYSPDKASDSRIGRYLADFLTETATGEIPGPFTSAPEAGSLLPPKAVDVALDPFEASVGTPDEEVGKDRKKLPEQTKITKFDSVKNPKFLKYRSEELASLAKASEKEKADAEDLNIRSEGIIKHSVLQHVNTAADLPRAVRQMEIAGLIPESLMASVERDLSEALQRPEVARWFDGTARVLNERPVLKHGAIPRRPDRLLVYPDGKAVVIDYKFGKVPKHNRHLRQIGRYVRLLRQTGSFNRVEGYLWYVNQQEIIPVI